MAVKTDAEVIIGGKVYTLCGYESEDWAQMLMRMYQRWAEAHKYKVRISNFQDGDEAGIKTNKQTRRELAENFTVAVCYKVMGLIYHYVVIVIGRQVAEDVVELRVEGGYRYK